MMWYGDGMGGWGYAVMVLSQLMFWGLLIGGAVLLVRWLGRPAVDRRGPGERVLEERFARGEIDEEEFRRRLELLHRA